MEVFVEPILPSPMLVVVGGGHVGKAVAHLAKWLGFRVAVSDDRPEFCTPEANPDADDFYPVPLAELPLHLNITPQTALVLTTRGSNVDVAGLPALLDTQAGYIGVIGSRKRWNTTIKELNQQGISDEKLARIHSPIGIEDWSRNSRGDCRQYSGGDPACCAVRVWSSHAKPQIIFSRILRT